MRFLFLVSLCLLTLLPARADNGDEAYSRAWWTIHNTLKKVREAGSQCPSCGFDFAGQSELSSPECRKTYRDFYKIRGDRRLETRDDSEINISVAFGYMDNRTDVVKSTAAKDVDDQYEKAAFFELLRAPCEAGTMGACGFKYESDDADVLIKRVRMIGPDGVMRYRTLRLRAKDSSVSDDDVANRNQLAEEQRLKSEETQRFFQESLRSADMVFYLGHARGGGGPDFSPPRLHGRYQLSDLNWYRRYHPGTDLMYGALQSSAQQPKIIGLFACYSKELFSQGLRQAAPHSGLILSGDNEAQTALAQAMTALDSVLAGRCEGDFRRSLDSIKKFQYVFDRSETRVAPVLLDGVFKTP